MRLRMTDMRQMVFDWFGGAEPATNVALDTLKKPGLPQQTEAYIPAEPIASVLGLAHFAHPRANREIVFEKVRVAYEFRRGKRRTIGLTVNTEGLVVSAPRWTPVAEVETMLREKERWVIAKLGEARTRHERMESARIDWREGVGIPFLGEQVILVLDPRQRHGRGGAVLETGAEALPGVPRLTLHVGLPHSATPEQLRDTTQAWLMRQARRVFTARLDHFAPLLGVQWQKLSLSSAGTRWGSASADGSIRLNWRLVHFSESIIDYVVVHELAHLREMNHGPRFWAHVESVMPDYAARRGELKDEAVPKW